MTIVEHNFGFLLNKFIVSFVNQLMYIYLIDKSERNVLADKLFPASFSKFILSWRGAVRVLKVI